MRSADGHHGSSVMAMDAGRVFVYSSRERQCWSSSPLFPPPPCALLLCCCAGLFCCCSCDAVAGTREGGLEEGGLEEGFKHANM